MSQCHYGVMGVSSFHGGHTHRFDSRSSIHFRTHFRTQQPYEHTTPLISTTITHNTVTAQNIQGSCTLLPLSILSLFARNSARSSDIHEIRSREIRSREIRSDKITLTVRVTPVPTTHIRNIPTDITPVPTTHIRNIPTDIT